MTTDYSGRLKEVTIPSEFQRLDTAVTDPDRFVNARDRNIIALNHNILLARAVQQPLLHWKGWSELFPSDHYAFYAPVEENRLEIQPILQVPVYIPPYVTEVTWTIEGYRDAYGAAAKSYLYTTIDSPNSQASVITDNRVAISTVPGRHSGVTSVPTEALADGNALFSLYTDTHTNSADLWVADHTVVASGPDWVEVTDVGTAIVGGANWVVLVIKDSVGTVRSDIIPRRMIHESHQTANNLRRFYVERPWTAPIVIGDDTVNGRSGYSVYLRTISLYASAVTDFFAEPKR